MTYFAKPNNMVQASDNWFVWLASVLPSFVTHNLTACLSPCYLEEPTDEVLSQLMREAAQDAQKANEQATQRYFEELRQAAAAI